MSFVSGALTAWHSVGWGAQLAVPLSIGAAAVLGMIVGILAAPTLRRAPARTAPLQAAEQAAATPASPPAGHRPRSVIDRELERSRRHNRPFAVICLPGQGDLRPLSRDGGGPRARRTGLRPHGHQPLPLMLRSIDRYCFYHRDIYLILPETGQAGAERLVARIKSEVPGASSDPAVRLAVFPEDGVTAEALLGRLQVGAVSEKRARAMGEIPVTPGAALAPSMSYSQPSARALTSDEV